MSTFDDSRAFHVQRKVKSERQLTDRISRRFFSVKRFVAHGPVQTEFSYRIINENLCQFNNSPDLLIFVLSKSENFEARQAIRRTWGNVHLVNSVPEYEKLQIKILFFLDIDESSLMKIEMEQSIFKDLVQVQLPQHYSLSSYRDMAILHWTEIFCPEVPLTMKTDDDIFLNIFLLANVLNEIFRQFPRRNSTDFQCRETKLNDKSALMFGIRIEQAIVTRSNHDSSSATARYIVTEDEYPCQVYPHYLSGFGYLVNRQARRNLLCVFFRSERIFPISNVYVTGILAEFLGIGRRALPLMINSRVEDDCQTFFTDSRAFACVSSSHHSQKSSNNNVNLFELFNSYWTVITSHFSSYRPRLVFRR